MAALIERTLRNMSTWLPALTLAVAVGAPLCVFATRQVLAAPQAGAADRNGPWELDIRAFEQSDRKSPPPKDGVVFVGASSIVRWDLPRSFPELGAKAINRGFGGSLAADSTRYADRIVIPYSPRIVVFYAGDNDIEANQTPEQITADFVAFERKVHAALPETQIIYISIKPSLRRFPWIENIKKANALAREYCASHPRLTFVDIAPQMLGADGKPRKELFVFDGLHMSAAGYRIWNDALRPHLNLAQATR